MREKREEREMDLRKEERGEGEIVVRVGSRPTELPDALFLLANTKTGGCSFYNISDKERFRRFREHIFCKFRHPHVLGS